MKTQKNILIAFFFNIGFAIFELIGGMFTKSVAIISDSIHDMGDALTIGITYFLEKKSNNKPDNIYTYGYARYSILGALITTVILTIGSIVVIYESISRISNPVEIKYDGMITMAIIGVIVNLIAALKTKEGDSINQKAVNLHMIEDVLGWIVVLIGSIIMRFTDIRIIDSLMSIAVALFILIHSIRNFKEILDIFLIKMPKNIDIEEIKEHIKDIDGIIDIHHIHIWSIDGVNNYGTMHVRINKNKNEDIKNKIKEELKEHGIDHVTIEIENEDEKCFEENCEVKVRKTAHHHH